MPQFCQALESLGAEVWAFERNNQIDLSKPGWAYRVARADVRDVEQADGFFAIVNGTPPDEGVMVSWALPLRSASRFLFRDDFRVCSDSEDYPLNLMLFAGLPEHSWREHFYGSIAELADPAKALVRWLSSAGAR